MADSKGVTVKYLRELARKHLGPGHSKLRTRQQLLAALVSQVPALARQVGVAPQVEPKSKAHAPSRGERGSAGSASKKPAPGGRSATPAKTQGRVSKAAAQAGQASRPAARSKTAAKADQASRPAARSKATAKADQLSRPAARSKAAPRRSASTPRVEKTPANVAPPPQPVASEAEPARGRRPTARAKTRADARPTAQRRTRTTARAKVSESPATLAVSEPLAAPAPIQPSTSPSVAVPSVAVPSKVATPEETEPVAPPSDSEPTESRAAAPVTCTPRARVVTFLPKAKLARSTEAQPGSPAGEPLSNEILLEGFFKRHAAPGEELQDEGHSEQAAARADDAALGELPESYGVDSALLLPIDPHTLFVLWDVNSETREQALSGPETPRAVLRIYEGEALVRAQEFSVDSRGLYVHGLPTGRPYRVEAHLVGQDGRAQRLGPPSSEVALPSKGPSPDTSVRFMKVVPQPPQPPQPPRFSQAPQAPLLPAVQSQPGGGGDLRLELLPAAAPWPLPPHLDVADIASLRTGASEQRPLKPPSSGWGS